MEAAYLFQGLATGMGSAPHELAQEWESLGTNVWRLIIFLFLVFLNAFFVAAEFAIVKVRLSQLDALEEEEGDKKTMMARQVASKLDSYLSATQLGITLASIALGSVAQPYLMAMITPFFFMVGVSSTAVIGTVSFVIAYTVVTFLHIVIGELLPKSLAIRKALGTTLWVAKPLHWFYILFKPAIWLFNGSANALLKWFFRIDPVSESELIHSADELRLLVEASEKSSEVTETEREIVVNALELNDLTVRDIMTPRNDVVSLDVEMTFEENLKTAVESKHTRFPLVEGHLDNTVGLVHIKDVIPLVKQETPDLMTVKRELLPVPELMPLDVLLKTFLERHAHLALVVDEFGGALGIVMLDDVLEELVGKIQDEFDEEGTEFRRVSEDEFVVAGSMGLHELSDHSDLELESPDVSTVGGYVTHLKGQLPRVGDTVLVEDYEVLITKADGRSVREVRFHRVRTKADGEAPEEAEMNGSKDEKSRMPA